MEIDYSSYEDICLQAAKPNNLMFKSFKSHPSYSRILEHPGYNEMGKKFLEKIKQLSSQLNISIPYRQILMNDLIGSPETFNYQLTNDISSNVSPTTLRYILTGINILTQIKKFYQEVDIVEIGGGYGGQSFVLFALSPIFNINIKSYTIFDLLGPSRLQKKYLTRFADTIPIDKIFFKVFANECEIKDNSFVISNYCLSEIDTNSRQSYIDRLFPKISHGFMNWNFVNITFVHPYICEQYVETLSIVSEDPKTGCNVEVRF